MGWPRKGLGRDASLGALQIDTGPQRSPSACTKILKKKRLQFAQHLAGTEELIHKVLASHRRAISVSFSKISEHADGERRGPASI